MGEPSLRIAQTGFSFSNMVHKDTCRTNKENYPQEAAGRDLGRLKGQRRRGNKRICQPNPAWIVHMATFCLCYVVSPKFMLSPSFLASYYDLYRPNAVFFLTIDNAFCCSMDDHYYLTYLWWGITFFLEKNRFFGRNCTQHCWWNYFFLRHFSDCSFLREKLIVVFKVGRKIFRVISIVFF